MAEPMNAPLAPYLTLGGGYTVAFTALDPASGAVVAGVKISNATISIDRSAAVDANAPPPLLVYSQGTA